MNTIMTPVHFTSKGRQMNTIERFHIYQETKHNNQINDRHTVQPTAIFEALVLMQSDKGHWPTQHPTEKKNPTSHIPAVSTLYSPNSHSPSAATNGPACLPSPHHHSNAQFQVSTLHIYHIPPPRINTHTSLRSPITAKTTQKTLKFHL
jgi:hypothetical protein